jgi:fatty acid desaturase
MATSTDPTSALDLAIRSARLLGFCSGVFGFVFVFAFGYFNKYQLYRLHFIAIGMIVWVIPGVLLMVNAYLMQRHRRRRAAIGAMFITAAHLLFALAALLGSCTLSPVSAIPILMSVLWVAATIQLLMYLWRSIPLLAHDVEARKGFEVRVKEANE